MHQQALQLAGSRSKPVVVAVKTCIRTFSTTQSRAAHEPSDNKGRGGGAAPSKRGPLLTGRERSRAAASEIGQLLRGGPRTSRASNNAAALDADAADGATPKVIDIKTLPNRGSFGGTNFVKLPQAFMRGGRGGTVGGREGREYPAGFSSTGPGRASFGGRGDFGVRVGGGRGRGRGRGGRVRGGRGGREGRGGRGGGGRRPSREAEDYEADKKADRASAYERFFRPETAEEHTYVQARDQGFLPEAFNPSMSVEGLLGFAPSMPIASASSAVTAPSAVMRSLRDVAGGQHYTPDYWSGTQHTARELAFHGKGTYFFSDLAERDKFLGDVRTAPEDDAVTSAETKTALAAKVEEGAGQVLREYIVDRVIKGRHVAPQFVEQGSRDPVSMARQSHLFNETYSAVDGRKFDGKIAALVAAKGKPAAGGKAANA